MTLQMDRSKCPQQLSLSKHLQTCKSQVLLWQKRTKFHGWLVSSPSEQLNLRSEHVLLGSNSIIMCHFVQYRLKKKP